MESTQWRAPELLLVHADGSSEAGDELCGSKVRVITSVGAKQADVNRVVGGLHCVCVRRREDCWTAVDYMARIAGAWVVGFDWLQYTIRAGEFADASEAKWNAATPRQRIFVTGKMRVREIADNPQARRAVRLLEEFVVARGGDYARDRRHATIIICSARDSEAYLRPPFTRESVRLLSWTEGLRWIRFDSKADAKETPSPVTPPPETDWEIQARAGGIPAPLVQPRTRLEGDPLIQELQVTPQRSSAAKDPSACCRLVFDSPAEERAETSGLETPLRAQESEGESEAWGVCSHVSFHSEKPAAPVEEQAPVDDFELHDELGVHDDQGVPSRGESQSDCHMSFAERLSVVDEDALEAVHPAKQPGDDAVPIESGSQSDHRMSFAEALSVVGDDAGHDSDLSRCGSPEPRFPPPVHLPPLPKRELRAAEVLLKWTPSSSSMSQQSHLLMRTDDGLVSVVVVAHGSSTAKVRDERGRFFDVVFTQLIQLPAPPPGHWYMPELWGELRSVAAGSPEPRVRQRSPSRSPSPTIPSQRCTGPLRARAISPERC
eukprot:Hpha_TRINITY_DN15761_c6_g8::TRINITY_DN15761_c6_g8_i1::g.38605::m.38605